MDSDAKCTKSEEDSSTKYILDYYRKFSQNKDLPKYFSGTSVSYLPEIRDELEIEIPEIAIKTDVDVIITTTDEAKQSEPVDLSPTSSIMSNRKLEWDNGADIGYSNCLPTKKIHKSCSLPILSEFSKPKHVAFNFVHPKSESSNGSNVKLVVYPYSSTSGENSSEAKYCSSSSSCPEAKKDVVFSFSSTSASTNDVAEKTRTTSSSSSSTSQKISSFKSTLSHLKKKIGLPDAQSTPNCLDDFKSGSEDLSETPVMKKREKPVKQLLLGQKHDGATILSVSEEREIVSSKEVLDESEKLSNNSQQNRRHKGEGIDRRNIKKQRVINLCLTKPLTVECIANPLLPMNKKIQMQTQHLSVAVQTDYISEKELIKIALESQQNINQSLQFFENHGSTDKTTSSTQTTTDIDVSKCDSFEFVKPNQTPGNDNNEVQPQVCGNPIEIVETSRLSSEKVHLPEAVSTSKLANFGEDIEKGIHILQKLLRSKKYDPATKKRYAKKIIMKLTESKYLEESSASSELFFPKKSYKTEAQTISQAKVAQQSTDSSVEKSQQSGMVQSKFPRHPEGKRKPSPWKKTLETKTFSHNIASIVSPKDELSSPTEIIPVKARHMSKNLFTLTNNEFSVAHSHQVQGVSQSANAEGSFFKNDTSLEKHFDSCSTSQSYHNWKQDKTLSEQVIEQKYCKIGDGDCLINFADKEREYQINWINREINQLGKLKHLLEKPPTNKNLGTTENITSVYSVFRNSDHNDNGDKGSKRKFVIETKLLGGSSDQRNFQLDGRKFTVANLSESQKENKKPRQVLADIEVISSDTTTNIIVTTICETCKRGPCICVEPVGHLAEENMCQRCGKRSCTCYVPNPIKSFGTICLSCHKALCTCSTKFSSTGAISKRCSLCRFYPCICSSGSKPLSYDGQFIPAIVPKLNLGGESEHELFFSSLSQTNSKSSTRCGKCQKCPCLCSQPVKDSDSTSKEELISKQSSGSLSGSLSKVFVNCNCNAKSRCNCGFVEKLLRHFDNDDLLKNINFEDNSAQTDPGNQVYINDIGIQTHVDVRNQNIQTSSRQQSKVSQTDETRGPQDPQNISIQTSTQTRDQSSKGVGKKQYSSSIGVGKETISQCSVETQAASQDGTTMTVQVKETSTEDGKKQEMANIAEVKETSTEEGKKQEMSNIAAQTLVERQHQRLQADWKAIFPSVAIETEQISQKSAKIQSASFSSVAIETEKISQKSVKIQAASFPSVAIETEQISQKSAKTQSGSQDQTTMTQGVQATSTVDKNQDFVSVDEATSYVEKDLVDLEQAPKIGKPQLQYVSAKTQTEDSGRLSPKSNNSSREHVKKSTTADADCAARKAITHDATTQDAATQDAATQDAAIRDVTHDLLTRDASTQGSLTQYALTRDTCGQTSPRELSSHAIISKVHKGQRTKLKDVENTKSRDCACVCGFFRKVHRRDQENVEKEPVQIESNSTAWNETSTTTTNGTTASETVTTTQSDTTSQVTCVCCKRKASFGHTSVLRSNNEDYPLCRRCVRKKPILTSVCYTGPEHVCTCTSPECAKAAGDKFRRVERYCTCTRSSRTHNGRYCCHCQFKLNRTQQSRNGIAYTLTLENESPRRAKSKRRKTKRLEEIKVKVPGPYGRKKRKEKENYNRRGESRSKLRYDSLEGEGEDHSRSELEGIQEDEKGEDMEQEMKNKENLTLQSDTTSQVTCVCCKRKASFGHTSVLRSNNEDYPLCRRCVRKKPILTSVCYTGPEHVCTCTSPECAKAAGDRFRRVERYSTCTRSSRTHNGGYCCHCQFKLKKTQQSRNGIAYTLTLENESLYQGSNKLFTEREMKEITKRNYKKLPEVQQRLSNFREQKLRNADKLIVDIFKRKIQGSVLKGKNSFPIDTNIVNMHT